MIIFISLIRHWFLKQSGTVSCLLPMPTSLRCYFQGAYSKWQRKKCYLCEAWISVRTKLQNKLSWQFSAGSVGSAVRNIVSFFPIFFFFYGSYIIVTYMFYSHSCSFGQTCTVMKVVSLSERVELRVVAGCVACLTFMQEIGICCPSQTCNIW